MFVVVKYPTNYIVKSGTYEECCQYLNDLYALLVKFRIKAEKTETFITACYTEETTFSIEYNNN